MMRISADSILDFISASTFSRILADASASSNAARAATMSALSLLIERSASALMTSSSATRTFRRSISSRSICEEATTLCSSSSIAPSSARCISKACCSNVATRWAMVSNSLSALSRACSTSDNDECANEDASNVRFASASSERRSANSLMALLRSATAPVNDATSSLSRRDSSRSTSRASTSVPSSDSFASSWFLSVFTKPFAMFAFDSAFARDFFSAPSLMRCFATSTSDCTCFVFSLTRFISANSACSASRSRVVA